MLCVYHCPPGVDPKPSADHKKRATEICSQVAPWSGIIYDQIEEHTRLKIHCTNGKVDLILVQKTDVF